MTIKRIIELLSEFTESQQETDISAVHVNGSTTDEIVRLFPSTEEGGDGEAFALVQGAFYEEEAKGGEEIVAPDVQEPAKAVDLMEALRRSLNTPSCKTSTGH